MRMLETRQRIVIIAVAAPLAAGIALWQIHLGYGYQVRVALVVATSLAAIANLCATAHTRLQGRQHVATPAAISTFVASFSCIFLAHKTNAALLILWGANLGMNVSVLIRAVRFDRRIAAHRAAKDRNGRAEEQGGPPFDENNRRQ